jgi:hypothetical protein
MAPAPIDSAKMRELVARLLMSINATLAHRRRITRTLARIAVSHG